METRLLETEVSNSVGGMFRWNGSHLCYGRGEQTRSLFPTEFFHLVDGGYLHHELLFPTLKPKIPKLGLFIRVPIPTIQISNLGILTIQIPSLGI